MTRKTAGGTTEGTNWKRKSRHPVTCEYVMKRTIQRAECRDLIKKIEKPSKSINCHQTWIHSIPRSVKFCIPQASYVIVICAVHTTFLRFESTVHQPSTHVYQVALTNVVLLFLHTVRTFPSNVVTNFIRMSMRNVFVNVFKSDAVIWWAAIFRRGTEACSRAYGDIWLAPTKT